MKPDAFERFSERMGQVTSRFRDDVLQTLVDHAPSFDVHGVICSCGWHHPGGLSVDVAVHAWAEHVTGKLCGEFQPETAGE